MSFFQQVVKADNIKTGKGGFQPIILEKKKFVQDKAVPIPGADLTKESPPAPFQEPFEEKEVESGIQDPALQKEISDGIIEKEIKKANK